MQHMHWWQATQVTPFRHPPAGRLPLVKSDVRRLTCALVVLLVLATGKSCVPLARPLLILHEHQHAQVTTSKQSLPLQGVCSQQARTFLSRAAPRASGLRRSPAARSASRGPPSAGSSAGRGRSVNTTSSLASLACERRVPGVHNFAGRRQRHLMRRT